MDWRHIQYYFKYYFKKINLKSTNVKPPVKRPSLHPTLQPPVAIAFVTLNCILLCKLDGYFRMTDLFKNKGRHYLSIYMVIKFRGFVSIYEIIMCQL